MLFCQYQACPRGAIGKWASEVKMSQSKRIPSTQSKSNVTLICFVFLWLYKLISLGFVYKLWLKLEGATGGLELHKRSRANRGGPCKPSWVQRGQWLSGCPARTSSPPSLSACLAWFFLPHRRPDATNWPMMRPGHLNFPYWSNRQWGGGGGGLHVRWTH